MSPAPDASHARLARVVRQHAGQLAASLVRVTGDFATAEDLVQDAVVSALQRWPVEGIPERPYARCGHVRPHQVNGDGPAGPDVAPSRPVPTAARSEDGLLHGHAESALRKATAAGEVLVAIAVRSYGRVPAPIGQVVRTHYVALAVSCGQLVRREAWTGVMDTG
jgi:hypothetical protein